MGFSVNLYNLDDIQLSPSVALAPVVFSANARGGPEKAEISIEGTLEELDQAFRWIDYRVVIVDPYGTPCWWGRVAGVTVNRGGIERGRTIEGMSNRVRVKYSRLEESGKPTSETTDWVEDIRSVAQYGPVELIYSGSDQTDESAQKLANRILESQRFPVLTRTPATKQVSGSLHCVGAWSTLTRQYYENPIGKIVSGSGGVSQLLGWGSAGDTRFCFADKSLQDTDARLGGLAGGTQLLISGSTSNNGVKICSGGVLGKEQISYTANTIYFTTTADVRDSSEGLSFVERGAVLRLTGSPLNSGWHLVDVVKDRGWFLVKKSFGGAILDESAGASVTIKQGQRVRLEDGATDEPPNSISVHAYGQRVAYSFSPPGSQGWTVAEIIISVHRVGAPTDSVEVSLHTDDGGYPGTMLDSAIIAGTSLYTGSTPTSFLLSNTVEITPGTTYWIRCGRTGAASAESYYVVALDDEDGGGDLLLWDGSAWQTRTDPAHLVHEVWGHTATDKQIESIQAAAPGRVAGVSVRVETGIETRQYRDGSLTALDELESLLDIGDSVGNRLTATIDVDEILIVDVEADLDFPTLQIEADGRLTRNGDALSPGEMPVGEWAVDGDDDITMEGGGPIFIEWAEYSVRGGTLNWRERGALDVWDFGRIIQG